MRHKARIIVTIIFLSVLSFLDHQYFYEPLSAAGIDPMKRQFIHLFVLTVYIPAGYWALGRHRLPWLKRLWLAVYGSVLALILVIGLVQWRAACFGPGFLDVISNIRIFFSTPLPLLIIVFLAKRVGTEAIPGGK